MVFRGFSGKDPEKSPSIRLFPGLCKAWCGDTRALLLHGRKVVPLSEDHVPKRRGESPVGSRVA